MCLSRQPQLLSLGLGVMLLSMPVAERQALNPEPGRFCPDRFRQTITAGRLSARTGWAL